MKCHNKIYRYFASSVSVTVSANAMLLPVYTDVFGYMSIYALVSNLVILPLVTFSYMLLAVSAIMCAISPAFGFLYYIIQYPIAAIRLIGDLIASLPFAKVNLTALGYVGLLYVITLVFISPINKLKTLPKISFVAGSGVIAALLICLI